MTQLEILAPANLPKTAGHYGERQYGLKSQ